VRLGREHRMVTRKEVGIELQQRGGYVERLVGGAIPIPSRIERGENDEGDAVENVTQVPQLEASYCSSAVGP
jgi:hypothetical protein